MAIGLIRCELRAIGSDTPGFCGWCAVQLTGRRTQWCSDACRDAYLASHFWTWARRAAIEAAGGYDGWRCANCGKHKGHRPEVNHKIPRAGAGYTEGCWHHLELLEVLCHECHAAVTAAQQRARIATARAAGALPMGLS